MSSGDARTLQLPSGQEIRLAVDLYLKKAFEGGAISPAAARLVPPAEFQPAQWLMSDSIERDPPNAPLAVVRSFALRLGNAMYPHMKLRISRPPNHAVFLFSVDSHDAILSAPVGSPDHEPLEALKKANGALTAAIQHDWEQAGLLTERSFMRLKILQASAKPPRA